MKGKEEDDKAGRRMAAIKLCLEEVLNRVKEDDDLSGEEMKGD